eukprot:Skav211187  [mRNA]  locus=scaffold884:210120:224777:+ [translate_table: standard]
MDVFFPKVHLPPELQDVDHTQLKGVEVNFLYVETADGKSRAERITPAMPIQGRPPLDRAGGRDRGGPPPRNSELVALHTGTLRTWAMTVCISSSTATFV